MAEFNYVESNYRFRSPIRYFTANDPYYWEVDNIPLQQLMENDLWLKDQLGKAAVGSGFSREDFLELKPYVNGTDNKVRVLPGRYSARINEVTSSIRFMTLARIAGTIFSEAPAWEVGTYNTPTPGQYAATLGGAIDTITSESEFTPTFMNGLMERAFTYTARTPYEAFIDYRQTPVTWDPHLPIKDVGFWANQADATLWTSNWLDYNPAVGFAADSQLQSLFMKFWRGIVRTSVVDVAQELEIEIPPFNINDFDYIDEDGNRVSRDTANIRIDLVFIYSRPIDALETKVLDHTSQSGYRTIAKPELGIIKGAGAILFKNPSGDAASPQTNGGGVDENGNPQIVADVGDSKTVVGGFENEGIRGSFPSPDDLMNVAPLLSEQLELNDPYLVGQSILPVAYIAVRRDTVFNEAGLQVLTSDALVDIRPFFRTTELSYNERAGIAASIPQISISNPVVSKLELKYELKRMYEDYQSKINGGSGGGGGGGSTGSGNNPNNIIVPRVVGGGYILGGALYGPEAAIQHKIQLELGSNLSQADLNATLLLRYGYRQDLVIPDLPDWDITDWALRLRNPDAGTKKNDRIFKTRVGGRIRGDLARRTTKYGFWNGDNRGSRNTRFGTDEFDGFADVFFVKKTIRLNRDSVPWMDDYTVNAQLLNCFPLTSRASNTTEHTKGGSADVWVSKERDKFTIYCAWVSEADILPADDREGNLAGFGVLTEEIRRESFPDLSGENNLPLAPLGLANYPSVTFNIVGIPSGYAGMPTTLAQNEPIIRLA